MHFLFSNNVIQFSTRLEKSENEILNVSSSFSNFMDKYAKIDYDVKQLMNIIHEVEDRSEKNEKSAQQCKAAVYETRQNLSDLEEHLKVQKQLLSVVNNRGNLKRVRLQAKLKIYLMFKDTYCGELMTTQ